MAEGLYTCGDVSFTNTNRIRAARHCVGLLFICFVMAMARQASAAPVSGFVYDAKTGEGLSGVRLQLYYDETDLSESDDLVPAERLARGEQNQLSGEGGSYYFEMPEGRQYRIEITSNSDTLSFPSRIVAPLSGFPRSGPIAPFENPRDSGQRPFYMRFDTTLNNARFLNNHIALDRSADTATLEFRAGQSTATMGDVLSFKATLVNGTKNDWNSSDGKEVYLSLALASGLRANLGSSRVQLGGLSDNRAAVFAPAVREKGSSSRLLRFGPFDLPAGQQITLRFQASVGATSRSGRSVSRMVAIDSGASSLSPKAEASVEILADRDFSTSTLTGRVFCDKDKNGWQSRRERGLFGAKIYSDTGAIATTDSAGRFHFTRIPEGSHLFKLDEGSLAGGRIVGKDRRLLHLSEGVPAQLSFAVRCGRKWVGADKAKVEYPEVVVLKEKKKISQAPVDVEKANRELVTVRGRIQPMTLEVNGNRYDVPNASLSEQFDATVLMPGSPAVGGVALTSVPPKGFGSELPRWNISWTKAITGPIKSWQFTIDRIEGAGDQPVFHKSGAGNPPALLEWRGLSNTGGVAEDGRYVARLELTSRTGVELSTRRYTFGIGAKANVSSGLPKRKSHVRVDRRLVSVSGNGGYRTIVPATEDRRIAIDILSPTGRYARFSTDVDDLRLVTENPGTPAIWRLQGDLGKGLLAVGEANFPSALWNVDAQLDTAFAGVTALETPEVPLVLGGESVFSKPLRFLLKSEELSSSLQWSFAIADEAGAIVYRKEGQGAVPKTVEWDGNSTSVKENQRYQYWLELSHSKNAKAKSQVHWFHVQPKQSGVVLYKEGRFFGASGSLKASFRNSLSSFVAKTKPRDSVEMALILHVVGDQSQADKAGIALSRYLGKLGMRASRYTLKVTVSDKGRDSLVAYPNTSSTTSKPSLSVNNRLVALQGDHFDERVELANDDVLVVDITTANGTSLRFSHSVARSDESQNDIPDRSEEDEADVDTNELVEATAASSLRVKLPRKREVLKDKDLAIFGSVEPGVKIRINGDPVEVSPRGRFHAIVELPLGQSELEIRAEDEEGGSSTIHWPVKVAKSHTVALGLLQGVVATAIKGDGFTARGAEIAGMTQDSTLQVGPLLLGVRAQGYVKSRFSGGAFSDSIELTAQIDTGRTGRSGAFFDQVVAANRGIGVFGDAAKEVQDVNTRGKYYGRVVAGDSSATIGSVHTNMKGGGDLFRYQRTTDGVVADIHHRGESAEFSVRAFSTTRELRSVRDINWFRATGGTLFYLRHGQVVEGSEKVRVVVRDRDSGLPLSEEELVEGEGYRVDYQSGRIRLTVPLSMTRNSEWVMDNMDSTATPMSGNTVFLSVQYEHAEPGASTQSAKGAYASTMVEKRLEIGAGIVSEQRDGQSPYSLLGGDASYHLGEHSSLRAEVAGSKQVDAGHFLSMDGGLSFGSLRNNSEFDAGSVDGYRVGWKLSAELAAKDWSNGSEFEDTGLSVYVQDVDLGFASEDAILDQGRFRFGARVQHRLSNNDLLRLRHEGQIAQLPRVGPTLSDVTANPLMSELDERASYLTSIQWARDVKRWHYKIEGMHQQISSTAPLENGAASLDASRLGVGAQTMYEYSSRTQLHFGQQFVSLLGVADPALNPIASMQSSERIAQPLIGVVSNVGGEVKLAPELSVGLDLYQRWNGDNAARLGLRSALSDNGSMYIQEQVGSSGGRLNNVTIVGAEDRFGDDLGGRSYGEYQVDQGVLGNRNRAVMGLGRQWQLDRYIGLGLGFEAQQAFGGHLPDGSAIGNSRRHVLHSSVSLTPTKKVRLAAQVELRWDHGDSGSRVDTGVLGDDPRSSVPANTFADHGGVVPGAALLVARGDTLQLVAGVVADWRLDEKHTVFARSRSSFSSYEPPGNVRTISAHFAELTTGWAFRPKRNDRFELLSRYSYLLERRPLNLDQMEQTGRSHVVAILPFARLPGHLLLSGKLAYKKRELNETLERGGGVETNVSAVLAILRLGYQYYGNWDLSGELRQLSLFGSVDSESKVGTLLESGYTFGNHLRFGVGYNFSHFSDNELSDLQRDSHGFFLRLTGHY